MPSHPTILAIASPPGRSTRGIVRISGEEAFALVQPHLTVRDCSDGSISQAEFPGNVPRGIYRAMLQLDRHQLPCLALIFPKPNSYTGEDSVELQVAGNPILLQRIIEFLIDDAKRRGLDSGGAEPGEFTARAFMNGRLSLTEAEGVAATISAQSDAQLRAAQLLSTGKLGRFARTLADRIASALALVEAGIDFTDEEDVIAIAPCDLYAELEDLRREIASQLEHSVGMEQLEAIPWVVITGPPNAGKSTLFNALLGRERAVVSPAAGTTRDVLAEPLTIDTDHGRAEVMLIDLAGADDEESEMNRRMQSAAREAMKRAELIIRCIPPDEVAELPDWNGLRVHTKRDLTANDGNEDDLHVSALTGEGLDSLLSAITDRLADRAVSLAADAIALLPRHESALTAAMRSFDESLELLRPMRSERSLAESELIASSMRAALDELAGMAGDITPDDVLGRIFAGFCIGK